MIAPGMDGLRQQALGDVVVLDLSHALAGPFATTMLGDYGAEIIKIEPLDGEIARAWGPPFYGDEAAYFVNLNRNKKSVALDLKHPDGKANFLELLAKADVVIENLRVGTVAKLGIGYEQVREQHPRLAAPEGRQAIGRKGSPASLRAATAARCN